MFPQELIDRFIDEVAIGYRSSLHIPTDTEYDLRSCSLAARCFRSRSQRHLLAYAPLLIARGETQSKKVQILREILETNEALRQCIVHLSINLRATEPIDDGDAEWEFHDENLPFVINMLAEMRQLIIWCASTYTIGWDRLSGSIKTAFWNTRFTSPHLSNLGLSRISISPHDLVYTWKSIKDTALSSVEMNSMGNNTSKNASIDEYRLEKVRVFGREISLPLALQNSQILGGLRECTVDVFRGCPYNIRQTWNVIHIASKSLEDLVLMGCFGA